MTATTPKYQPDNGLPISLVVSLAVLAGISVANLYYCQPLLNLIRMDLSLTEFEVNIMPFATQVGYALGLLLIIPAGDLYDRRKTIFTCFCVLVAALLACSLCTNEYELIASSFIVGVCSVAPQIFIPFVSYFSKPKEKPKMVGYVLSGLLIGILLSRFVSGWVGHLYGWRTMFVLAAIPMALSALLTLRILPYVSPSYIGSYRSLLRSIAGLVRQNPLSIRYATRAALCFGSFFSLWSCLTFLMTEPPFLQGSDTVGLLALCGIAGALTAMNAGKYVSRFGVERVNAVGYILMTVSWLIMLIFSASYAGIITGIVLIDMGMQCVQLSNQTATIRLAPEATSRMNTVFMATYFIGGSIGTFLSGSMWSLFGWTGAVASGLLLISLSICVTMLVKRKDIDTKDK